MDGVGNCTRCPKLSPSIARPLNAEVVIQCGTIFEPKGFDISRLCHSNLSRSEGHSFCGRKKRVHLRSISDPHLSSSCSNRPVQPMQVQARALDGGGGGSSRIKILWLLASDCQILDPTLNTKSWAFEPFLFRQHPSNTESPQWQQHHCALWALNANVIIKNHWNSKF